MFDIAPSELMLLAAVALVVIGPKDLPRTLRFVGQWVGRARGMARHFRSGIDEIIRQDELDEMQKKWAAENARIMAEHPMPPPEEADDAALALAPYTPVVRDEEHLRALAASTAPEPAQVLPVPVALPAPAAGHAAEASAPVEPMLPLAMPPTREGERG